MEQMNLRPLVGLLLVVLFYIYIRKCILQNLKLKSLFSQLSEFRKEKRQCRKEKLSRGNRADKAWHVNGGMLSTQVAVSSIGRRSGVPHGTTGVLSRLELSLLLPPQS